MKTPTGNLPPAQPGRIRIAAQVAIAIVCTLVPGVSCLAQKPSAPASSGQPAPEKPLPGLDLSSMDRSADPCADMYKFACGNLS